MAADNCSPMAAGKNEWRFRANRRARNNAYEHPERFSVAIGVPSAAIGVFKAFHFRQPLTS